MKMAIATALFALTLSATAAQPPATAVRPDGKAAAAPLAGTYTIVSGEEDGKAVPAERITGAVVLFTDDKVVGTGKDKKEFFAATYKLDTTKTPWAISMKTTAVEVPGQKEPKELPAAMGLVKKEGETVTIIYALPGGEAPKDFKTGPKQNLFVLKPLTTDKPNKFQPANPEK